jgi:hypothetical protein
MNETIDVTTSKFSGNTGAGKNNYAQKLRSPED